MKKLIPALCMLLVAAALLGTSTYAWFSMNETVTATGMSVTASAPTSLLISNTSATSGFGSTVALKNDVTDAATEFVPVAYSGKCASWYKLTDAAMATVNEAGKMVGVTAVADGEADTNFTNTKIGEAAVYESAATYVYHDKIWLKVEGENVSKSVKVKAEYATGTTTEAIKGAMHIVFVVDGEIAATIDMSNATTPAAIATLTANADGKLVDVYYFLSGNDDDCKNSNIKADALMSVNLTFSTADVQ